MKNARRWGKLLLWVHLFACCTWLALFRSSDEPPSWMIHVFVWSILAVQFTWGFTVGLIVGPSRKRRQQLWWSLLLISLPLWFCANVAFAIALGAGPLLALIYLAIFVMILACETYCGVLLGARAHALDDDR